VAIKGTRATVGSLMNAERIDTQSDPSVERLLDTGANFFARATCPEVPAENWQKDILTINGHEITDTDTAMTVLFNMFNRCPVLSVPAGMTASKSLLAF